MWVKREHHRIQEEIARKRKQRFTSSLNISIYSFIGIFLAQIGFSITVGIGNRSDMYPPEKITISELPAHLPLFLYTSLITSVILFPFCYFMILKYKTTICETCYKIFKWRKEKSCECGGVLAPIEEYRWEE